MTNDVFWKGQEAVKGWLASWFEGTNGADVSNGTTNAPKSVPAIYAEIAEGEQEDVATGNYRAKAAAVIETSASDETGVDHSQRFAAMLNALSASDLAAQLSTQQADFTVIWATILGFRNVLAGNKWQATVTLDLIICGSDL